jgi:iduronate 2-sulfatase
MKRLSLLALLLLASMVVSAGPTNRLNVLFIAVDDLRPELGCYGNRLIKSPNIDSIASRGMVFNRAYCQQAVCSPSRTSLLTGLRPDTTKVYDLETHFRDTIPDVVTLPQHFIQNGYHAQGFGKIYHGGFDDPKSWTVPHWKSSRSIYGPEGQKIYDKLRKESQARKNAGANPKKDKIKAVAYEAPDYAHNELPDGETADKAIEALRQLKDKPFFLAVGFVKPHLPFVAPKKYWDLYDEKDIQPAPNPFAPKDSPSYALTDWGELRAYYGMPRQGPLSEREARTLKHGYYACVSYMDAQVGRVLKELDNLGLREKTIVVLWGDHGWQLGEHGLWCKHTNFEVATRAPLLISVPGQKSAGKRSEALVEFVDIYPTLAELCGLEPPAGLEGTSFKPLIENPNRAWKKAVFSQYPRRAPNAGPVMGYSMRTDRYRFTQWASADKSFVRYELYDHHTDPEENVNVAGQPQYAKQVRELTALLEQGWRGAQAGIKKK